MNEMIKHVNIPQPVIDILDLLHTKTEHAYLVGGCMITTSALIYHQRLHPKSLERNIRFFQKELNSERYLS